MTTRRVPHVGNNWEELSDFEGRPDRVYMYIAYSRVQVVTFTTSFRVRTAIEAEHEGWLTS